MVNKTEAVNFEFLTEESGRFWFVESNDEFIALHVKSNHYVKFIISVGGYSNPAALT